MPLYDIRCNKCGKIEEIYRSISEIENLPLCCSVRTERMMSAPHIVSEERNYKPYLGKNGRLIDGKKQHREYLKENGFIEVSGEQKHLDKIKSDKKVASKKARRKRIEEYLAGKPLHESQRTA